MELFRVTFDPLHGGHLDYFEAAKAECDHLICIINNDEQRLVKGGPTLFSQDERMRINGALRCIDEVVLSIDMDTSVSKTLAMIKMQLGYSHVIFFNSGDRGYDNQNYSELLVCKGLGIEIRFLDLPKTNSSSLLKQKLA